MHPKKYLKWIDVFFFSVDPMNNDFTSFCFRFHSEEQWSISHMCMHSKIIYILAVQMLLVQDSSSSKHLLEHWQVPVNSLYRTKATNLDYGCHKILSPLGALEQLNISKCAWNDKMNRFLMAFLWPSMCILNLELT